MLLLQTLATFLIHLNIVYASCTYELLEGPVFSILAFSPELDSRRLRTFAPHRRLHIVLRTLV
jgi:hypothetical protein